MLAESRILREVAAVLEQETSVNIHRFPLRLSFADGALTLEGEVKDIRAKKRALEVAAAVSGVTGIVDRLHLVNAEKMPDGTLRDHVCTALVAENLLGGNAIRSSGKGASEVVRAGGDGYVDVEVNQGVVVLNGSVTSLTAKRLAGVLAWWVPGSRDVINGIEIVPPEEDNDDEVVDAIRLALEKDPFVNSGRIGVRCRDYIVTLDGVVRNETERQMVEADCWYVFRVNQVVNLLQVEE